MEARALLATFTVNTPDDAVDADPGDGTALTANGQITLRSAIQESNALAGGDTIILPAGTYTLTIPGTGESAAATGDLDISGDLTISGGASGTTIVDGGKIDRIFEIMPDVSVSISGVTIENGETPNASISPGFSSDGGAIDNKGNLTLTGCVVKNSVAGALLVNGQPSQNAFGGGISNGDSLYVSGNESLVLDHSVVSGNKANGGGGIENLAGTVIIRDSTIDGNSATSIGGGISTGGFGLGGPFADAGVSLVRSTLSDNSSFNQGAGINLGTGKLNVIESTVSDNQGIGVFITFHSNGVTNIDSSTITANAAGGISAGAAVDLANSIVAGNTAFDVNGLITSQGYNLMQNTSFATISGVTTGNILGQDAKLGPLADNGGPTKTHLLLANSPAIDAANPAGDTDPDGNLLTVDQRGLPRKLGTASDIGPVENQATAPLIATTTAITSSANPSTFGESITFTATVAGMTGPGIPTGTVTFLDGQTVLGTSPLDASGVAEFITSALSAGGHTITGSYGGDAPFQTSISAPLAQVVNSPTAPSSDLAVGQTASVATPTVGSEFTYILTVTDAGPSPATGVVLTDNLQAGMTLVSASASQGVVTQSAGTLTADLGSLAPGAMATITVVVVPTTAGPSVNTARVSGAEPDPVEGNNLASLTTVVIAPSTTQEGPTVIRMRRFGFHHMRTTLVLTFSAALDAAKAQDPANYTLIGPLPGYRDILIVSAVYDASKHSVRLSPVHRLNVHNWYHYQLSVSGIAKTGFTDTSRNLMDGDQDGTAGGDYILNFHGFGPKPAETGMVARAEAGRPRLSSQVTRHRHLAHEVLLHSVASDAR